MTVETLEFDVSQADFVAPVWTFPKDFSARLTVPSQPASSKPPD